MANSDKDILITPNKGTANIPEISFVGQDNAPIKLRILDDNTLSFEGNSGQLFSINDNLTVGSIFSVNDVSGVPSINVDADGTVGIAQYAGNIAIGKTTANYKVDIDGQLKVSTQVGIGGSNPETDHGLSVGGNMRLQGRLDVDNGSTVYKTVSCYIKGTGLNNNASPQVLVDGVDFIDSFGRGIMLVIINKSDLTKVSRTTYDTYGSSTASNDLAAALRAMTTSQIGIMVSYDAIEAQITSDLRTALIEQGLYKFAGSPGGARRPYACIFHAAASDNGKSAYEIYQSSSSSSTYATIYTRLFTDGSAQGAGFSGNTVTNALVSGDPNTAAPVVFVNQNGDVGINTTEPSSSFAVDCEGSINVRSGSNFYIDGVAVLPVGTETNRGSYLVSDGPNGAFWAYPGATTLSSPLTGFRYRSIMTHGYIGGGYKGSQPWRSLNKTWHQTDTTFYCGEQIDRAASYLDGTWSDFNGYIHGTVNAYSGNSAHTSSYNLNTGILRTHGDGTFSQYSYGYQGDNPRTVMGYNVAGGWDMSVGRNDCGCSTAQTTGAGYISGGGSSVTNKLHFFTEIMYTTTSSGYNDDFVAGIGGENLSWYCFGSANSQQYMNHSNDAWTNQNYCGNNNGWCKALGTKWGHFYIGSSTNNTSGYKKVRFSDGATLSDFNKVRSCGEENMQMGQDWGYKLGDYDGQQNNHTTKMDYSTDVETTMGTATRPKGHYGQSSAACSSAAASVTAVQPF